MKKHFSMFAVVIMVLMIAVTAAGCGSKNEKEAPSSASGSAASASVEAASSAEAPAPPEDFSGLTDGTVIGKRVFIHDSNVAFFGYENLLCSALFQEGSLSEFVIEGGLTGDIYALAVYGNDLYVSASDGFFKYSLDMFSGSGTAKPIILMSDHLSEFNQFQIRDNTIYFIGGDTLYSLSTEGGSIVPIATEAADFEVTSKGIYYTKRDGSLRLYEIDTQNDNKLTELAPAVPFCIGGGNLYYRVSSDLMAYSIAENKSAKIDTASTPEENTFVWTDGPSVLYQGMNSQYRLITGDGEKKIAEDNDYPLTKAWGFVYGHYLASLGGTYEHLQVIDMANGVVRNYNLTNELASQLSQINQQGGSSGGSSSGQSGSSGSSSSSAFDICAGLDMQESGSATYIYGNDFLLIMPSGNDWELVQNSKTSFSINYLPSKNAGYGGLLVAIEAYDPADKSYEQLPSYSVAGKGRNVNKVFVAVFPTDVQFDPGDKTQSSRYNELFKYLQKIGDGAVNSPFQTADSD